MDILRILSSFKKQKLMIKIILIQTPQVWSSRDNRRQKTQK